VQHLAARQRDGHLAQPPLLLLLWLLLRQRLLLLALSLLPTRCIASGTCCALRVRCRAVVDARHGARQPQRARRERLCEAAKRGAKAAHHHCVRPAKPAVLLVLVPVPQRHL
jgi:hypothetical protein